MLPGVTSASLIVIILVAAAVGAGIGGVLGHSLQPMQLAIISGFIATIVAFGVRNWLLNYLSGAGPDESRTPIVVAVFASIASLAGSLAAKEILDQTSGQYSAIWLGTLAGLVSAVLMALLMITYHMYPEPRQT